MKCTLGSRSTFNNGLTPKRKVPGSTLTCALLCAVLKSNVFHNYNKYINKEATYLFINKVKNIKTRDN